LQFNRHFSAYSFAQQEQTRLAVFHNAMNVLQVDSSPSVLPALGDSYTGKEPTGLLPWSKMYYANHNKWITDFETTWSQQQLRYSKGTIAAMMKDYDRHRGCIHMY